MSSHWCKQTTEPGAWRKGKEVMLGMEKREGGGGRVYLLIAPMAHQHRPTDSLQARMKRSDVTCIFFLRWHVIIKLRFAIICVTTYLASTSA